MITYTKEQIKIEHEKIMTKFNTISAVCIIYVIVFLVYVFSYSESDHIHLPTISASSIKYAYSMTGGIMLVIAIVLPIILSFKQKKQIETFKREMDKPGNTISLYERE